MNPIRKAFADALREADAIRPAIRITDADVKRVAAEFDIHERTLVRALAGLEIRGRVGERARRAVAQLRDEIVVQLAQLRDNPSVRRAIAQLADELCEAAVAKAVRG